jgi:hypothetical protein
MTKRPLTPTYIFFYLLFWPDTWRIVCGLAVAFIIAPHLNGTEADLLQTLMIGIMLAAIGYTVSAKPARFISTKLRSLILKNR